MRKSLVTHVTTAIVVFTIALPTVSVAVWADEGPPAGAPPAPAAAAADKYSAEELKEIVGPVALYPDVVLSSLMPATSFPDQVAAAAKWLAANPGAKADAAPADWDGSIKALVEVPDVLKWLGENPEWVQQLGYAVSVQQSEVLAAVQAFRKEAQAAGNLKTDEHMSIEGGGTTEAPIVIEPTDPEIIYVPTYEPTQVVSSGYAAPYWGWGAGIAMGALGAWAIHEMNWGGHGHGDGSINVNKNVNRNTNVDRNGPNRPSQFQGKAGGQRPAGGVKRPSTKPGGAGKPGGPGGAGRPGGVGGPGGAGKPGGVGGPGGAGKPGGVGGPGGAGKPGGAGGIARPGGAAPSVPGMKPGSPGGAGRPGGAGGAGGARPAATPARNPPNHAFGGAGSGQAAQKASSRGGSSMNRSGTPSRSYSGGGRSGGGGGSRGGGGGGSRGGGGGGRGGGGGGRRR